MQAARVRTILMVEDEVAILELMTEEFQDNGFRVYGAETAECGLEILKTTPGIDLLFTDIRLPGKMDGWDLAEEARCIRPDLKVMYATAWTAVPSRLVSESKFFQKPYKIESVLNAMEGI